MNKRLIQKSARKHCNYPSLNSSARSLRSAFSFVLTSGIVLLIVANVSGQNLKMAAQIANKPKAKKESDAITEVTSPANVRTDDLCQKYAEALLKLKLEAAGKVKEIERVRLLDADLGAMQQTTLAEINTKIKNAELALTRCEEKDRERKAAEQLKQQQEHELKLEQVRHENNKELTRMQIQASQVTVQPLPAEKDFFEIMAGSLDAQATFQQGFQQIKSSDKSVQVDGLRKVGAAIKQTSPK